MPVWYVRAWLGRLLRSRGGHGPAEERDRPNVPLPRSQRLGIGGIFGGIFASYL